MRQLVTSALPHTTSRFGIGEKYKMEPFFAGGWFIRPLRKISQSDRNMIKYLVFIGKKHDHRFFWIRNGSHCKARKATNEPFSFDRRTTLVTNEVLASFTSSHPLLLLFVTKHTLSFTSLLNEPSKRFEQCRVSSFTSIESQDSISNWPSIPAEHRKLQ